MKIKLESGFWLVGIYLLLFSMPLLTWFFCLKDKPNRDVPFIQVVINN